MNRTFTLHRIDPMSLAKILGVVYGLLGIVGGAFVALLGLVSASFSRAAGGLVMILLAPVIYAAVGFIGGYIVAWLYNALAPRVGGINFSGEATPGS